MESLKIHPQTVADVVKKLLGVVDGLDAAVKAQEQDAWLLQSRLFGVYGDLAYCIGAIGSVTSDKEVQNAIDARYKPQGDFGQHSGDDAVGEAAAPSGGRGPQ